MINLKISCIVIAALFLSCASQNNEPKYILDQKVVDRKLNISFNLPNDFKCGSLGEYLVYLENFPVDSLEIDFNNIYKELDTLKIVNNKAVELGVHCYQIDNPGNIISFEPFMNGVEITEQDAYAMMYILDKRAEELANGMPTKRFSGKLKWTNKFPYLAAKYNVIDDLGNRAYLMEIYYIQRKVDAIFILAYVNTDQTDFVEEIVRSINML